MILESFRDSDGTVTKGDFALLVGGLVSVYEGMAASYAALSYSPLTPEGERASREYKAAMERTSDMIKSCIRVLARTQEGSPNGE